MKGRGRRILTSLILLETRREISQAGREMPGRDFSFLVLRDDKAAVVMLGGVFFVFEANDSNMLVFHFIYRYAVQRINESVI